MIILNNLEVFKLFKKLILITLILLLSFFVIDDEVTKIIFLNFKDK